MNDFNTIQVDKNLIKDKKVGIVVPIYNVSLYLRECLDSIVNQTYTNFSVMLVNDGSTDNNESLSIAKEYALKDSRFIVLDKENGGLSSARNVGIEYFRNIYKLELNNRGSKDSCLSERSEESINAKSSHTNKDSANKDSKHSHVVNNIMNTAGGGGKPIVSNTPHTTSLKQYKITNNNPYNIKSIYTANNIANSKIEQIDYIIFLDSDDYWKPYCLEECIRHSSGADIVWFNSESFFDNIKDVDAGLSIQEYLNFEQSMLIKSKEWLCKCADTNLGVFYFSWDGLIDFQFLVKIDLHFLNKVIHEDHNFGCMLFLQARNIYVLKKALYMHRNRPNSITRFDKKNPHIVPHCKSFYDVFQDSMLAKQYHIASSWFLMFMELIEFLETRDKEERELIMKLFFPYYIHFSLKLFDFTQDPLNLIPKLKIIEPYLGNGFKYRHRVRLESLTKYKKLKPLFGLYDRIKDYEKTIRLAIKNKKR